MIALDREKLAHYHNIFVAYSGGIDSHCLLHLISTHSSVKQKTTAVYVHHGLSEHANDWQQHCQNICQEYGIRFTACKITSTPAVGDSIEAWARVQRYEQFAQLLNSDDVLLTGHHADDQAETLLLQLIRGAGVEGLAAMPRYRKLGKGCLYRPLLSYAKNSIQEYAAQHKLQWVDDESNAQEDFSRNYIRHSIMPNFLSRWPSVATTLNRSAQHCAESAQLNEALAEIDYESCSESCTQTMIIDKLLSLSIARQKNVLRYWINQTGFITPSTKNLTRILTELVPAAEDGEPLVEWQDVSVRRFQGKLYLSPKQLVMLEKEYVWDIGTDFSLVDKTLRLVPGGKLDKSRLPETVSIRFRQGGEKIRPQGDTHTRTVKSLFQTWQIAPWQRNSTPLIYHNDEAALLSLISGSFKYPLYVGNTLMRHVLF